MLTAILVYNFAKAPVMLALGVVLVVAPTRTLEVAQRITAEISESGSLGWRAAHALEPHLTPRTEHRAAIAPVVVAQPAGPAPGSDAAHDDEQEREGE